MRKNVKILFFTMLMLAVSFVISGKETKAASKYMIKINKQQNVVTIYKDKGGKYKPYKAFVCSSGYATPVGTFYLKEKIRWHILDGPTYGQYCTRIHQSFLFHSVWYYEMQKPNTQSYIQYNKLGTTASHGCVRLTVGDAKWIYDNCPTGTKVVIYNSSNPGPLGKPSAIKVSGYAGWDPTDPDPANPWRNAKPKIEGVKNQKVPYDSKFNILKGVKVTNSTGFNAKKLLETKIYYKVGKKYKKVKKLSTTKPGKYKVVYRVTDEINRKAKKTAYYTVLTKVSVQKITLKKTKKTLYLGGKASQKKFTLKVKKITPKKATYKKVLFTSSDKSIVTVSKKGVVKAKKAGTAIITVTSTDGSNVSATCKVTVRQYAKNLTLTAPSTTVNVGVGMQLKALVTPTNTTNKKVTYTSSNTSVATVSASGMVKGLKPGTVTITAKTTDGSKLSASITIQFVYKYKETVTTVPSEVTVVTGTAISAMTADGTLPSQIVIKDEKGNTANAQVTWTSTDYSADVAGKYTVTGKVTLPTNWVGTIPSLSVQVTVQGAGSVSGSAIQNN